MAKQDKARATDNSKPPVTGVPKGTATGALKAQVPGAMKTKAVGNPKTKPSGTPTGHGTGQQYQQQSTGLNVSGAGRTAPPAQRRRGRYVPPPPGRQGYDVTDGGSVKVPKLLLENHIKAIYVEFLGVGQNPLAKNHVVFKVDFFPEPDGSYPGDYEAARISMEVDYDVVSENSEGGTKYQPGTLYVKPVTYLEMSISSVRTFELAPSGYAITLELFLQAIVERSALHIFSFWQQNDRFYGCRDFM